MNRIAVAFPAVVALAVALGACSGGVTDSAPTYQAASSSASSSSSTPAASDGQADVESPTPDTKQCSGLSAREAVDQSVGKVPTVNNWAWETTNIRTDGFDDCAALSWVVLPIERASNSSPYQIMLFHNGEFLGTATAKAYGFAPQVERIDDATIQVTYTYMKDGEATAFASGRTTATFTWDDDQNKVVMSGQTPDDVGGGN